MHGEDKGEGTSYRDVQSAWSGSALHLHGMVTQDGRVVRSRCHCTTHKQAVLAVPPSLQIPLPCRCHHTIVRIRPHLPATSLRRGSCVRDTLRMSMMDVCESVDACRTRLYDAYSVVLPCGVIGTASDGLNYSLETERRWNSCAPSPSTASRGHVQYTQCPASPHFNCRLSLRASTTEAPEMEMRTSRARELSLEYEPFLRSTE
jgi:hypothetical protein